MEFSQPTYWISPEICKANIRRMAEKAEQSGTLFRPHFKTHQSRIIGRWFREAGVSRITVSSLGAAVWFAKDGWDDITVAFPVNLRELSLINQLASDIRLGLLLEDAEVAKKLDQALEHPVDIYIKIDTGYHRTGLGLNQMAAIRNLASLIKGSAHLRLKGLLTHAGNTYQATNVREVLQIFQDSSSVLRNVRKQLGPDFQDLCLSYGDTPSCSLVADLIGVDEIRPGNFVFYDLMQRMLGVCSHQNIAGVVVCPVVAVHPERNQAVLYGGAIHFSKESLLVQGRKIYGQLVNLEANRWSDPIADAWLISLSQEHGILEASPEAISRLEPGQIVGIIPVHACLTAHSLRGYLLTDGTSADYFSGI